MENLPIDEANVPSTSEPPQAALHTTLGDSLGAELKKKLIELAKANTDASLSGLSEELEPQKLAG